MPENKSLDLSSKIKGWGVDADFSKRPGVPRERYPARNTGAHWAEPEQQIPRVKINWSTERPGITPVFGTTCPPKLLSGMMKNFAYKKFSEGRLAHWLILLTSDRVDMVEEAFLDIFRGKLPRPIREMGLEEEILDNQTRVKRVMKGSAVTAGLGVITALAAVSVVAARARNREVVRRGAERFTRFTEQARKRGEEVLSARR